MSGFPIVEVTVYPYECDAFGHLNQAACLQLLERARWEALARGPGVDLFHRNGVWPAARRTVIEYRASALPGDRLRVETLALERGTTSFTLRHRAVRTRDDTIIAEADLVFVCVDRLGRVVPIPEELGRVLAVPRGGKEAQRIAVEGSELTVEVRGNGPALLLVHGYPLDRTLWRHQLPAFARWRRIAPDLRGFGASRGAALPPGGGMQRYADDLVAILDRCEVDGAVCCGLSMGGYILFELLRRHPERVRGLVLMDTKAGVDAPEVKRARDESAALAARDGAGAIAERMLPKLLSAATVETQPETVAAVRKMMGRASVEGIVAALQAMRDRPDSRPQLANIAVPTLVVCGAEDSLTPPGEMQAIAAAVRGARYVEIASAAHLTPLEQPLAVNRALTEFLTGLE